MREDESVALRLAWDHNRDRLWRALLAWSGDRDVASDAIAEAFAQAAPRLDRIADLDGWLWRASFKIAAGMLDSARRRAPVGTDPMTDQMSPSTQLPDEAAALVAALAQLSESDRLAIVLCQVGGWSAKEVGGLVGASPGAIRVRLHRAKSRLRTIMEVHDD